MLLDSRYLARGLTLYRSLERTCDEFRLRAVCLDEESERLLGRIDADRLELVSLSDIEGHDRELRSVSGNRSRREYYWTSMPCICRFFLEREPGLRAITYLDADLMFSESPAVLFEELGTDSILLVPHRWGPGSWGCSEGAWGTYNPQVITFRRDANGLAALNWWRERCLEFCPAGIHPGYFGGQKYLDDWPERFEGVHVLQHLGGGLAPWNASQYRLQMRGGQILVDGQPLVFHHYQGLSLHQPSLLRELAANAPTCYRRCPTPPGWIWATRLRVSREVLDLVWEPYLERLAEAAMELVDVGADESLGIDQLSAWGLSSQIIKPHLPRYARRTYWRARRVATVSS
jgi:hypothetical protein